MDTAAPLQFLGNAYAVAMLLQGGEVLAWGEPLNGGLIPSNLDAVFVDRIYANGIGFTAKKTTRKIISWGNFPQQYIPERIRDIGGTAQVSIRIELEEHFSIPIDNSIIILRLITYTGIGCYPGARMFSGNAGRGVSSDMGRRRSAILQ